MVTTHSSIIPTTKVDGCVNMGNVFTRDKESRGVDKDNLLQKQFLEERTVKLKAHDKDVKIERVAKKTLIEEQQQTNVMFLLTRKESQSQTLFIEGIYKILSEEFNYALCSVKDGDNNLTQTIAPLDDEKCFFYKIQCNDLKNIKYMF